MQSIRNKTISDLTSTPTISAMYIIWCVNTCGAEILKTPIGITCTAREMEDISLLSASKLFHLVLFFWLGSAATIRFPELFITSFPKLDVDLDRDSYYTVLHDRWTTFAHLVGNPRLSTDDKGGSASLLTRSYCLSHSFRKESSVEACWI